jgi:Ca2+-binding RTX toxin-like protein
MPAPNIVFIAVDDLFDFNAFRTAFGVTIQTPNLDALLARSTEFRNAFSAIPVCNPSRASTMLGQTPFETGVVDLDQNWWETNDPADTWPAILRDNGYYNTTAGKIFHYYTPQPAHVNARLYSETPNAMFDSFDASQGTSNGGAWNAIGIEGQDQHFYDYRVAQHGIDFLARYSGTQPFSLSLGFKHPHNTYETPQRFYDLYDQSQIRVPTDWAQGPMANPNAFAAQFMANGQFSPSADMDLWRATVEGYLAAISHMDYQVGRFLDALNASPHADNTAVILYSDHGYQLGDHDHFHKFTLWEESLRAPLFVHMPGQTTGQVVDTPVSFMDIFPTIMQIAGIDGIDRAVGQSLLPLIDSQYGTYEEIPIFSHVYGSVSIRDGNLRYIRYQDGSEELYNIANDPAQTVNLALQPGQGPLLAQLRTAIEIEVDRYGGMMNIGAASVTGTAGADTIIVDGLTQTAAGGAGNDTYYIFGNPVGRVIETAGGGIDTVMVAGLGTFVIPEHVENLVHATPVTRNPDGTRATVTIQGNAADNVIRVQSAHAQISGGDGNDFIQAADWSSNGIWGGNGNDTIIGGAWADWLYGGAGNDEIFGGRGNDRMFGGDGNDSLYGGAGDDTLTGGAGADSLFGGAGFDMASYQGSNVGVWASLVTNTGARGHAQGDRFEGIEGLIGSDHNDTLMGGAGNNRLEGGAGDDYLNGGAGDDTLIGGAGADTLVGGAGFDTASYRASNAGVWVSLVHGTGSRGHAEGDRLFGIEALEGSDHNDTLMGGAGNDLLTGGAGNDFLNGGAGDDTLIGGTGADTLVGGAGRDLASYAGSDAAVHVSLASGLGYGGHAQGDQLWGIEDLLGSSYNDTLIGSGDANMLTGGDGNDWMDGGAGNDTLYGGTGHDTILGGLGNDLIYGGAGNDSLWGGAGDDTIYGGTGSSNAWGGDGRDVMVSGRGSHWMRGGAGDDVLVGGRGGFAGLWGGSGADRFVIDTNAALPTSTTHVNDFNYAEGDRIVMRGLSGSNSLTRATGQDSDQHGSFAFVRVTDAGGREVSMTKVYGLNLDDQTPSDWLRDWDDDEDGPVPWI